MLTELQKSLASRSLEAPGCKLRSGNERSKSFDMCCLERRQPQRPQQRIVNGFGTVSKIKRPSKFRNWSLRWLVFCSVPAFCRAVWLLRSRFWSLKWLGCFVMFLIALFFVCFDCFKSSGSPFNFVESRTALQFFVASRAVLRFQRPSPQVALEASPSTVGRPTAE